MTEVLKKEMQQDVPGRQTQIKGKYKAKNGRIKVARKVRLRVIQLGLHLTRLIHSDIVL